MYGKVYTDRRQFTKIGEAFKYPVLSTNLKHSGLFYSKGGCGYYIAPLAAYGAKVHAIWFLGRWWHVYTSSAWIS